MSNSLTTVTDEMRQREMIRVLGNSLYPGARHESIELVLSYCRVNGLDPMLRPVHIVPTSVKVGDRWEMRDVLMPGIADYRIKASRSGQYAGKTEPEFGQERELHGVKYPEWCRVTIYRLVGNQSCPFTAVERWLENYAADKRDSDVPNRMWKKRPYAQLAKCTEAQALRMAFPEFSGGTVTSEEMEGKDWDGPTIQGTADRSAPPSVRRTAQDPYLTGDWKPTDPLPKTRDLPPEEPDEHPAAPEVRKRIEWAESVERSKLMKWIQHREVIKWREDLPPQLGRELTVAINKRLSSLNPNTSVEEPKAAHQDAHGSNELFPPAGELPADVEAAGK